MKESTISISINPFSEFLTANAGRKKTIIKQQKNPRTYIVAWYRTARGALIDFFRKDFDLNAVH